METLRNLDKEIYELETTINNNKIKLNELDNELNLKKMIFRTKLTQFLNKP